MQIIYAISFFDTPSQMERWGKKRINIYYLFSLLFGPCQAERHIFTLQGNSGNIVFMIFFCTFSLWIFQKSIKKGFHDYGEQGGDEELGLKV